MAKELGIISGVIAGLVTGGIIGNYIIFPVLLGGTIAEVLQAL